MIYGGESVNCITREILPSDTHQNMTIFLRSVYVDPAVTGTSGEARTYVQGGNGLDTLPNALAQGGTSNEGLLDVRFAYMPQKEFLRSDAFLTKSPLRSPLTRRREYNEAIVVPSFKDSLSPI